MKIKLAFELDGWSPASYAKKGFDRKREAYINELCAIETKI